MRPFTTSSLLAAGLSLLALPTGCITNDDTADAIGDGKGDVYGKDDRVDWHEAPVQWQTIAKQSVVSFVEARRLQDYMRGEYPTLAGEGLCADEKFLHQPSIAYGSGYLVDSDAVATAAHVFRVTICTEDCEARPKAEQQACMAQRDRIVFGPRYNSYTSLDAIDADDIYYCDSLIDGQLRGLDDYAIIKLDRPVSADKQPVRVRTEAVEVGDELVLISHPTGLPVKIDRGGAVQEMKQHGFSATLDAFHGSSGGPVFDTAGKLVGHLVQGPDDFAWDEESSCHRPAVTDAGADFINQVRDASFLPVRK